MSHGIQLVDAADTAAALLHPLRARLLEQFRQPRSTAEVARTLGLPRQRLGHHVRLLRKRGLLRAAGERRNTNFVEQLLQATARGYVIAPQALGDLGGDPGVVRDRFSIEYLAAAASRTIRDLAALGQGARREGKKVPTITLDTEIRFAGPEQQAAFAQEVTSAIAALATKYHDEDAPAGRRFRFTFGGYPARTDGEDSFTPTTGDQHEKNPD